MHQHIQDIAEDIRDAVVDDRLLYAHALELGTLADQLERGEPQPDDPDAAASLVARMRACAERAVVAIERGEPVALRPIDDEALELLRAGSRMLVRSGVRLAVAEELFEQVEPLAVLVGELAKAGFVDLIAIRQQGAPRRCTLRFEFNPLHAFAPAIAAGASWAIERVEADEADRAELVACLSNSFVALLERGIGDCTLDPMTHVTARALTSFTLAWTDRAELALLDELEQLATRTIAALDGCDIDPSMLEAWVHVGAAAGILHLCLRSACAETGREVPDHADCTVLIDTLDPHRYEHLGA